MSSAKAVFNPALARTIFVRVKPAPRHLSERRAVLRTLQKYGQIEVFQTLTEAGSFNAVAAEPSTVQNLIGNSPLRFDLVPDRMVALTNGDPTTGGVPRDIYQLHKAATPTVTTPATTPPPSTTTLPTSFVLHIFPSNLPHKHKIMRSPLYGPWPSEEADRSLATSALEGIVPGDMAARGMADWEAGGQMVRAADRPRQRGSGLLAQIVEQRAARRRERREEEGRGGGGDLLEVFKE